MRWNNYFWVIHPFFSSTVCLGSIGDIQKTWIFGLRMSSQRFLCTSSNVGTTGMHFWGRMIGWYPCEGQWLWSIFRSSPSSRFLSPCSTNFSGASRKYLLLPMIAGIIWGSIGLWRWRRRWVCCVFDWLFCGFFGCCNEWLFPSFHWTITSLPCRCDFSPSPRKIISFLFWSSIFAIPSIFSQKAMHYSSLYSSYNFSSWVSDHFPRWVLFWVRGLRPFFRVAWPFWFLWGWSVGVCACWWGLRSVLSCASIEIGRV